MKLSKIGPEHFGYCFHLKIDLKNIDTENM